MLTTTHGASGADAGHHTDPCESGTDDARRGAHALRRASTGLALATLAASGANYLVNIVLARLLTPAEFGDANLIVTMLLIATAVALTLQLAAAHRISTTDHVATHRRRLLALAWRAGLGVAVALVAISPWLAEITSSRSALPIAIMGVAMPLYLVQAVERGVLQGRLHFGALSATFLWEAGARTVITVGLVAMGFGAAGAAFGLAGSFAVSWIVARRSAISTLRSAAPPGDVLGTDDADRRRIGRATTLLLVGQIVVNNGDVVLAKVLFDADTAGGYAVVALVGRAIFFCTWSIVNVAFPHAARGDTRAVADAVRMVTIVASGAAVAVAVAAPRLAPFVFGEAYREFGHLFGPYALATALFAVTNAIATLGVASGDDLAGAPVAAGAIGQSAILLLAANDPATMVMLQVVAMALLLVVVICLGPIRSDSTTGWMGIARMPRVRRPEWAR